MTDAGPDNPIYRRWVVLVLLFAALGPLALPLLWRSPHFSRGWKIALTAAVLVLTAVLVWLLWIAVDMFVRRVKEAWDLGVFRP